MRKELKLGLVATLIFSGIALWLPGKKQVVTATRPEGATRAQPSPGRASSDGSALPSTLKPVALDAAARDIFAPEEPSLAPVAKAAASSAPAAPAPPPPPPPAMPYRVVGVMFDPDGKRLVVLGQGDKSIIALAGVQLDGGFVIESVNEQSVRVLYPPQDVRYELPIPRPIQS